MLFKLHILIFFSLLIFIISSSIAIESDDATETGIVLIGDSGKNNDGQSRVSLGLQELCTVEKCDFGMLAGDNVYPAGVKSKDDPILETMFDKYYNPLNIPFLVSLGNHDYGTLTNDWKRARYQLLHADRNPLFYIPHYYYIKETEHAVVAVIDTTRLMWAKSVRDQIKMMKVATKMAKAKKKWLLVLGHHPYLSNGKHGNAGRYERLIAPYFVSGTFVKWFLDRYVCGKADFYLSGHDHSLQVFDSNPKGCNTHLVVSGSAATATKLYKRNKAEFESLELGFFHLGIKSDVLSVRAYNDANNLLFEKNYLKKK